MNRNDTRSSRNTLLSKLLCVKMTLRDVLYVSYALPAAKLVPMVPGGLQLATVGGETAFISIVMMTSKRVRLSSFPLLRLHYSQFNIRTYVADPVSGRLAVYFIRSGVTSAVISFATKTIGIPWQLVELQIDFTTSEASRSLSINGNWEGAFTLKAQADKSTPTALSPFESRQSAVDFLIRPLIGFAGHDRRLMRFAIQHAEVEPESWSLRELDCPLFEKLVEIDNMKKPHSVFYLPTADFSIFLPPTRIRN